MLWRHAAGAAFMGFLLCGAGMPLATAYAEAPSAVSRDAKGFGDDQFARMIAGGDTASRVPALAAMLDAAKISRPQPGPPPASDRLFGLDVEPALKSGPGPSGEPLARIRLSSAYGLRFHPILGGYRQHKGVDLAAPTGSPIYATADGIVSRADWNGGYGLAVELRHPGEVETRYGHMSRLNVAAGQRVRKGDTIGFVGSTGRSTGPHLHYEVLVRGRAVNPMGYLQR